MLLLLLSCEVFSCPSSSREGDGGGGDWGLLSGELGEGDFEKDVL